MVQALVGTVNLCLVTIKYKNPSCKNITVPQKYVFDFEVNISNKDFYFSKNGIYVLKIHLST
jgi:hypothetical protein